MSLSNNYIGQLIRKEETSGEYDPRVIKSNPLKATTLSDPPGPILELLIVQGKILSELESVIKDVGFKFKSVIRENQEPICDSCDKPKEIPLPRAEMEQQILQVNNRLSEIIDNLRDFINNCAL
jgi:hypothetical protein